MKRYFLFVILIIYMFNMFFYGQLKAKEISLKDEASNPSSLVIYDDLVTPTPTVTPEISATAEPSITPTEAPKVTPLVEPSVTPIPTITPLVAPSNTPIATPTPTPTFTPIVKPSPTPKPTPKPITTPIPHKKVIRSTINPILRGNLDTKALSITFDDGFHKETVKKVLDILKKYNIKATFFIIGKLLKTDKYLWKRAINEGHQICNHTYNHVFLSPLSDNEIKSEITNWENAVKVALGEEYFKKMKEEFPYFRLPGADASHDKRVLKIIKAQGYTTIGWSEETIYSVLRFYNLKNGNVSEISKKVSDHIISNIQNGNIVLLHFNVFDITRLDEMLKGIINKGYKIENVTDILNE